MQAARTPRFLIALLVVVVTASAGIASAQAQPPVKRSVRGLASAAGLQIKRGLFNLRRDRDTRLTTPEFRKFRATGALPSRVSATAVATTKLARVQATVRSLDTTLRAGQQLAGIRGGIDPISSSFRQTMGKAVKQLKEAHKWNRSHGLVQAEVKSLATQILGQQRRLENLKQAALVGGTYLPGMADVRHTTLLQDVRMIRQLEKYKR